MNKVIKSNWHWFLIGTLLTTGLVCGGIAIKCNPTAKEKILYYVCATSVNYSKIVSESKKVSSSEIREVRINQESLAVSQNSRLFGTVYDSTDIYIYPEVQLERTIPLSAHFSEEKLYSLIPNAEGKELYLDGNKYCAIKVYDATTEEGVLKDYINYHISEENKQNYYLSFYKSSLHINGLNHSYSDNALKIVNRLLEL